MLCGARGDRSSAYNVVACHMSSAVNQYSSSLHAVASLEQQLVRGFKTDQACTWVLGVQHHVHDDYG